MSEDALQADLRAIARIGNVDKILKSVSEWTGLRFTAVARVTAERWITAAVHDGLGFGLVPGGELDVTTTLCSEVRGCERAIVIDHASIDPVYKDHRTPKMYKFESYISVPLFRQNGELFGTVCGLDPSPHSLRDERTLTMLTLFAELISLQLAAAERHDADQLALTREREAATLREEFIAVLGHDLRNPLAAISAGTDILLERITEDRARSTLGRMRNSTKRIAALVDDVLDVARARLGGGIALDRTLVSDLEARLEHIVSEVRAAHPKGTIEASFERVGTVHCDAKRIEQVASNLLANAITHGKPGTVVRFDVGGDADSFTMRVSNEAAPIPDDLRSRLFEPFERGADATRSAGVGLGLYIVAQIAKSHHGTIEVESNDRTTFTFSIPRR